MASDWRLQNLEDSPDLRGIHFTRKPYINGWPGYDHDHCGGCMVKLVEPHLQLSDVVHEGYAATAAAPGGENYAWVCVECFETFASEMGWVDETP